jgi:hypothetical protein
LRENAESSVKEEEKAILRKKPTPSKNTGGKPLTGKKPNCGNNRKQKISGRRKRRVGGRLAAPKTSRIIF